MGMGAGKGKVVILRPNPDDHVILVDAAGHVAVDEEADPAEYLFFFQVRERPKGGPDACSQESIVGRNIFLNKG
jgi:hypothetical protein